jgi:hypothetical protein
MRTDIPQDVLDALNNESGVSLRGRLTIYKNRTFAKAADFITHPATLSARQPAGLNQDAPLPQGFSIVDGIGVTLYEEGGILKGFAEGNESVASLDLHVLVGSRPTVVGNCLFYVGEDLSLNRAILSVADHTLSVEPLEQIAPAQTTQGILFGLSNSEAIYLFLKEGGVGITCQPSQHRRIANIETFITSWKTSAIYGALRPF